jgi:hypothetical protein
VITLLSIGVRSGVGWFEPSTAHLIPRSCAETRMVPWVRVCCRGRTICCEPGEGDQAASCSEPSRACSRVATTSIASINPATSNIRWSNASGPI